MVMDVRPVTEKLLVQTLMRSLDVVFLDKALYLIVSAEIGYWLTLGVNLRWNSVPSRGVNDIHPLSTTEIGVKQQPSSPSWHKEGFYEQTLIISYDPSLLL